VKGKKAMLMTGVRLGGNELSIHSSSNDIMVHPLYTGQDIKLNKSLSELEL
jgi:hypothetical protein